MTVFGAIVAALLRKVNAFAEVKTLVADVEVKEQALVKDAEGEVKAILAYAKASVEEVETKVETEVKTLRDELVTKI